MIKMIAFDVDGTLAADNQGALPSTVSSLLELEAKGVQICLISGKPVDYVAGFARQLGLKNPIVAGENGAVIYFDGKFPTSKELVFEATPEEKKLMTLYKETALARFGEHIWVQPMRVNSNFFLLNKELLVEVQAFTLDFFRDQQFRFILHSDGCFDVTYQEAHKGWAIQQIREHLGLKKKEVATVGNAENDLPMFQESYFSFGVQQADAAYLLEVIDDCFPVLTSLVDGQFSCPKCEHAFINKWMIGEPQRFLGECDSCEHTADMNQFVKSKRPTNAQ